MFIKDIIIYLENKFPLEIQEDYDNCGLIIGDENQKLTNVLITLDCTEDVLDEAINKKCELIICHHPIIFSGLKKITGRNYVERIVIKAIKSNISIYAIHTNLDNHHLGVNKKIADKLGLINNQILFPKKNIINKLTVHAPIDKAGEIRNALFDAGAGNIGNYSNCSFNTIGEGTFKGGKNSNPYKGEKEKYISDSEIKIEVVFPSYRKKIIINSLVNSHPYEEISYEISNLDNYHQNIGSGMFGQLEKPVKAKEFLQLLKKKLNTECIRHTNIFNKTIKKVAVCGGSGSFLLERAKNINADIFITSDFKYHEFFDSDQQIIIADIGHYESEQFTSELLGEILKENFTKFATHLSEINTNPINYS